MSIDHVAVIDIGKTNAKVALVDMNALSEIDMRARPNTVRPGPPFPHFDVEGIWEFLLEGLAELHRLHGIDAISITAHGASAVLLDREGGLAAPMLDYEHDGPDTMAAAYDALRPDFAETGSPRLPMGLNLGAQLHWLLETQPGLRERLGMVVTYPQYWSGRLTGHWAAEVTSLGCHTDLWQPRAGRYSSLVERLGLDGVMAPIAKAGDLAGTLLPEIAARTGLSEDTPVASGIHDSNASLYPHLLRDERPLSIVSTGTWVICMALEGREVPLDPARDSLVNVAANGQAVPSARFMGGREYETIKAEGLTTPDADEIARVLDAPVMLLPSVAPGSGPFPEREARWIGAEGLTPGERSAALAFYLALMTRECLGLIGADGEIVVEGPFAANAAYLDMLAAATGLPVAASGTSATGTSVGAALLLRGDALGAAASPRPVPGDERLAEYAAAWRKALDT